MNDIDIEIAELTSQVRSVANAITPIAVASGTDDAGGHISSLTEAVMGITAGLHRVAESLSEIAASIRDKP